jgi:hypothetical protein
MDDASSACGMARICDDDKLTFALKEESATEIGCDNSDNAPSKHAICEEPTSDDWGLLMKPAH